MARAMRQTQNANVFEPWRKDLNGKPERTPDGPATGPNGTTPAERDQLSQAPRDLDSPPRRTTM